MNIMEGLSKFAKKPSDTTLKEMQQLHAQQALLPVRKEDMSYEESKQAIRYLKCHKESLTEDLNANTGKEDTSSPTVSLEMMMLSCAIDDKK